MTSRRDEFNRKPISVSDRMPKRKTGQRKKAEKQKERQKLLQSAYNNKQLVEWPCNFLMVSILNNRENHHATLESIIGNNPLDI